MVKGIIEPGPRRSVHIHGPLSIIVENNSPIEWIIEGETITYTSQEKARFFDTEFIFPTEVKLSCQP